MKGFGEQQIKPRTSWRRRQPLPWCRSPA